MEILFEFILELIVEGALETGQNKKVPKPVKYILLTIILSVISLLIFLGITIIKKSVLGGIFVILTGILLMVGIIIKFCRFYDVNTKTK